ncbi:MAG: thioredoxin [Spirochaetaceae bacterium]|jgi:thioredoxin 1|nr:thioredoxin [Spirochaetaceae bacterium]
MSKEFVITSENFEAEVLKSSVPVLLDFWADWCNPCRMIAPFIEQIADEYQGKLKVGKINVDEQNSLAAQHTIVSIPTLIVYKDGKPVHQQSGALPKNEIEALIKNYL